jgi:hypothetical protein
MYWDHPFACPYPEGCDCGAQEYNDLLQAYQLTKAAHYRLGLKIKELEEKVKQLELENTQLKNGR